jgi:GDPmannose 4,6-dehydratase
VGKTIRWEGQGIYERGFIDDICVIEINAKYFRPAEVDSLLGNANKAKKILKWRPIFGISDLIRDMIDNESA